jgi:hypothetical protein
MSHLSCWSMAFIFDLSSHQRSQMGSIVLPYILRQALPKASTDRISLNPLAKDVFEEVGILLIRQHPSYDYTDLTDLLTS